MNSLTVLLIEDEPMQQQLLADFLQPLPGIQVVARTALGREGVHLAQQLRPMVAVIDIRLPDMSGIEVARQVRCLLPDIHLIFLTGSDTPLNQQAARDLGAAHFLPKANGIRPLREALLGLAQGEAPPGICKFGQTHE